MRPAIQVAQSLNDVTSSWQLVYRSYRQLNLIDENPYEIFTVPQAVHADSAVFFGQVGSSVAYTMTAYHDGPLGLPLDSVYQNELDRLRRQGRSLLEVGLFADRRVEMKRQIDTLLDLMRYATYFGLCGGSRDAVVGVHPRHAAFYRRFLGFQAIGPVKDHPKVNDAPVVLLHLDWVLQTSSDRAGRALAAFVSQPLDKKDFTGRFRFGLADLEASVVGRYLSSNQVTSQIRRSA